MLLILSAKIVPALQQDICRNTSCLIRQNQIFLAQKHVEGKESPKGSSLKTVDIRFICHLEQSSRDCNARIQELQRLFHVQIRFAVRYEPLPFDWKLEISVENSRLM